MLLQKKKRQQCALFAADRVNAFKMPRRCHALCYAVRVGDRLRREENVAANALSSPYIGRRVLRQGCVRYNRILSERRRDQAGGGEREAIARRHVAAKNAGTASLFDEQAARMPRYAAAYAEENVA